MALTANRFWMLFIAGVALVAAGYAIPRQRDDTGKWRLAFLFLVTACSALFEYAVLRSTQTAELAQWLRLGALRSLLPVALYLALSPHSASSHRWKIVSQEALLILGALAVAMVNALSVSDVTISYITTGPAFLGVYRSGFALPVGLAWTIGLLGTPLVKSMELRSPAKGGTVRNAIWLKIGLALTIVTVILDEAGLLSGRTFSAGTSSVLFLPGLMVIAWALTPGRDKDSTTATTEAIVAAMSDALILLDSDRRIVRVNSSALRLTGGAPSDLVGRDAAAVFSDDIVASLFPQSPAEHLITASSIRDVETTLRRPAGGNVSVSLSATLMRGIDGMVDGVVCIAREITERLALDRERERLITELQAAQEHVQTLRGLIPICSWCRNILDDKGYWTKMEEYISEHSDADFTHGICPDCYAKFQRGELK